jgi:D-alanyl-lipoteichoic acid acyltransferase DltB (MBOAT superfamily)
MLIGGLWHGASWNFVLWGGLNGIGIVVYKLWKNISPWKINLGGGIKFWE